MPAKNIILLLCIISINLSAQIKYDPLYPPNSYRSSENPNYWKNKLPYPGYWQQDVYYEIDAEINEETDIISASQKLKYWNNSPDTLYEVYFHLYQNAFQPGSYYDELQKQNHKNPIYGKYEKQGLGTKIESIKVNNKDVITDLDNTIFKIYLNSPLFPGDSTLFELDFKTYFDQGSVRRRMKSYESWGYKHYNGVHWYPRICVYDSKFGWTKDQHLGREFYGNFGTFDVKLTFASNFIVEATGNLVNRSEVLPDELREKLDLKNFANKKWNSEPSVIIPYNKNNRKTWYFHAENVHDFAFTADPTYRIGEARWKDKVCYSLVQEPHASRWLNAADFGAECLKVFSEDFGEYVYHKVIVADAQDGMEYPMITLDRGSDPGYRDLLAHEIGHMWFFGQIGNNETYRALLDEGFTQFLTAWALIKIDGEFMIENKKTNWYKSKFYKPFKAIDSEIYYSYIKDATKQKDPVLATHSDQFDDAHGHGGGYRHVYYKTAAMLYNLQYVLGDELFLKSMKHYFNTWKMAHPYDDDFRNVIINYTKVDLNWFFDQWLETDKRLDYSINKVNKIGNDEYELHFERKKRMQSPIDFTVIAKDQKKYKFHIPNQWFVKETDGKVLEKWHGWDLVHPTYKTVVNIPNGIEDVIIDPSERLGDCYMPDNSLKRNINYELDHKIWQYPDWRNYEIKYRPDIWWNSYDGIKYGVHANGSYMKHHHILDLNFWINSAMMQEDFDQKEEYDKFSYRAYYKHNLDLLTKNSSFSIYSSMLDGLATNEINLLNKSRNEKFQVNIKLKSLYRNNPNVSNYLIHEDWAYGLFNNRIDINFTKFYSGDHSGNGLLSVELMNSGFLSDYDYTKLIFTATNNRKLNKLIFRSRAFFQFGNGSNWAPESKLYLSGSNLENMMNNKFTRSKGFINSEYLGYGESINHFHHSGGLNLRGYSGYLAPEYDDNGNFDFFGYNGTSGGSINLEVDFTNLIPRSINTIGIKPYIFADAGIITNKELSRENFIDTFSEIRADAGIGFFINVSQWTPLETVNPLTVRLDFPLFLNRPPANDKDYFMFRWLFGISKLF